MEESMEEKTMASEISVEENPFNRLPEELTALIFDKISDAKCLCICSSVSKSFAALVLQTRGMFVKMPGGIEVCSCHPDPSAVAVPLVVRVSRLLLSFLQNTPRFLHRLLQFLLALLIFLLSLGNKTDVWPSGIINFLKKFSCLESLIIHFSFLNPDGGNSQPRFEPLLRWKYGLPGFIFVSAKNRVALTDENTGDHSVRTADDLTLEEIFTSFVLMQHHFRDSVLRVAYIHQIVAVLPNIKNVAAMDDMKQGIVVLDEEDIAVMKEKNPLEDADKLYLKMWKAPVVELPLSGCVMEDVSLFLIRPIEGCDALVVENSFEEEEYRELATVLVREEASFEMAISISAMKGRH